MVGLPGDGPGAGPDRRLAGLSQTGGAPLVCAACPGEGRASLDGAQDVGAGGAPGRAALGEAPTGHQGMDGGVVWAWLAPGVPPPGTPRARGVPAASRVRAVAAAGTRAWEASRGGARRPGRRGAGTGQVRRPGGPGRCLARGWASPGCV